MHNNFIKNLDLLPRSLEILDCSCNYISSLDNFISIASNLQELYCSQCEITSFKIYVDNNITQTPLKKINCYKNLILELDNLPEGLETLICGFNKIKSLDKLPSTLKILDCRECFIKTLDNLPEKLEELHCEQNYIKTLYNLPLTIKKCTYSGGTKIK